MAYSQIVSALFGGFLSAYLGASDYGVLNLARTIFTVALAVTPFGCDIALIRSMGRAEGDKEALAGEVNWLRVVSFCVATFLFVICLSGGASVLEEKIFRYPGFGWTLIVTIAALPFAGDSTLLYGAYRGLRLPTASAIANYVLQPTARMVLIAALLFLTDRLAAATIGTSLSYAFASLFMVTISERVFPARALRAAGAVEKARATLRFAPVLGAAMFLAFLTRTLDIMTLAYFSPSAEVGRYSLVILVSQMVGIIGSSIGQTLGSRVAAAAHTENYQAVADLVRDNMSLGSILCAPVCIAVILWGPDIDLLLGPTYVISWAVFATASVTQWVVITTQNSSYALSVTGRHQQELFNNAVGLAIQAIACLLLTPYLGMLGAAVSTTLSTITINTLRQRQIKAILKQSVFGPHLLLPVVLAGLVGMPLLGLEMWLGFRAWWLTAALAGTNIVLGFTLIFTLVVKPQQRQDLVKVICRRPRSKAHESPHF